MTESKQIKKGCMIVIPRLNQKRREVVGYDIKFTTDEEPTTLTTKELDELQEIRDRLEGSEAPQDHKKGREKRNGYNRCPACRCNLETIND